MTVRPLNDPAQYDDLVAQWWEPRGAFAMLHWLAVSRAAVVPVATRPGAVLLDVACGGGLLAPHVADLGYRHVGVDIGRESVRTARAHGVAAVRGDARRLPVGDGCADVVVAGEILEHVDDPFGVVDEVCRVLRPGGTVVIDTIAATRRARVLAVMVAERIPGGPPPRLHDPALFVDRERLAGAFARHGVEITLRGLFPHPGQYLSWLLGRREDVRLLHVRDTSVLFQGTGIKGNGITRSPS